MFDIRRSEDGTIALKGRLDAASAPVAREFLATVDGSARLDFSGLDYIASVGLGVLAAAQRRLLDRGEGLVLAGLSPHLREVLSLAGFEGIFAFE
ncbi:MAG: STAS domain-containing protein [Krumholzibacteria bacterium]|nr:STAS domain-containing protein [Candidatus Krumholzibacteria bacterium]